MMHRGGMAETDVLLRGGIMQNKSKRLVRQESPVPGMNRE